MTAWTQRNDLKAAIQQAYVNRKQVTLAKSQRIPDPSIGFNYMWTTYTQFQDQYFQSFNFNNNFISNVLPNLPANSNGPFSSANANPNPPTAQGSRVPMQPGYQLTFTQETPILYQYQGQINQAKAQLALQEKQNDLLRAQIASAIVSAYEALQVTRDNLFRFQQDMLPSSEKVAQLARRGYEMGKTDLATAMLAQQQYQQMRQAYFDAVVAYQNAWADMEKAIGVPLRI